MTMTFPVIPAQAGTQNFDEEIPTFVGMTIAFCPSFPRRLESRTPEMTSRLSSMTTMEVGGLLLGVLDSRLRGNDGKGNCDDTQVEAHLVLDDAL